MVESCKSVGHPVVFDARRGGRVLRVEKLSDFASDTERRALVETLRTDDGYPLPLASWDSDDEEGIVVLCREGDRALGSVRLVKRQASDERWLYMPATMVRRLPGGAEGFAFAERLVVRREARSLEVLSVLLYATAQWGVQSLPGVTEFAAVIEPGTAPLITWFGGRQLSESVPLHGLGIDGVLMGGQITETASRIGDIIAARGWQVVALHVDPRETCSSYSCT